MVQLSTHDYAKEGAAVLLNAYKKEEDYFSADGRVRLELIVEESNDDFEDVLDYFEGQNDLQDRGEEDSRIVNESNANDSGTTLI